MERYVCPKHEWYCSGLPDRTTLRLVCTRWHRDDLIDCSGLPDRTTLRRYGSPIGTTGKDRNCSGLPDRTTLRPRQLPHQIRAPARYCSGLPDRTTLRNRERCGGLARPRLDCSGLPDRTTLRRTGRTRARGTRADCSGLPDRTTLRPGRPLPTWRISAHIVPVFQTGLYIEAGTLERRGGEVLPGGIGPDVLCSYQSLF